MSEEPAGTAQKETHQETDTLGASRGVAPAGLRKPEPGASDHGHDVPGQCAEPTSLHEKVKELLETLLIAIVMFFLFYAFEQMPWGHALEYGSFANLQRAKTSFQTKKPDTEVVLLDISDLWKQENGQEHLDGDTLTQVMIALAGGTPTKDRQGERLQKQTVTGNSAPNQGPIVIAVDKDFSPGDEDLWSPATKQAFLKQCAELSEGSPFAPPNAPAIFLGVFRTATQGKYGWLGNPNYSRMAAAIPAYADL